MRGAGYAVLPCSLTPGCDRGPAGNRPDFRRNVSWSCDRRLIRLQIVAVTRNRPIVRRRTVKIMRKLRTASLVLMMSIVSACRMYTSVGQTVRYPPGSDYASAQFHLVIGVDGARGRAYADRTLKSVHVTIWKGETKVLERQYRLAAGSLRWNVTWNTLDDLRITFFEYGNPVSGKDQAGDLTRVTRQVFAVAFTFDKTAMSFVEAPAPVAIVDQIAQDAARENKRYIVEIYFEDSADNEVRILREVASLAGSHDLQSKAPPAGLVGRLAEWSAPDFSLAVQRYDSLHQVAVEIQDYGDRKRASDFAGRLRALPGVARTRRFASVNVRSGPQDPDAMVQIVRPIAKEYGLTQMDKKGMFTVARFGTEGLHVTVDFFESDGTIRVSIEDFSWHSEFADIEQALRSGLNADGRGHGAGGV